MSNWNKPIPPIDPESKPYWEACRRHELILQRTEDGTYYFYPRHIAPGSLRPNVAWVRHSGRGNVYTFSITCQHGGAGFRDDLPFVLAYVELEETGGVKMITNIVDCDPETVHIGMPVEVVFVDVNDDIAVPMFKPRAMG